MTAELDAVRQLEREHGTDLAFVVNHSGGRDSTRMLDTCAGDSRLGDTGFEHQKPISAAEFARQRCAEFGLKLDVVRNPRRTYLEMVEQRGMFPSARHRQCTSDLKRGPIEKYILTLPHSVIVNCIGIRGEESHARSRLSRLSLNSALTTRARTVYNWLPIFDQRLGEVLAWHWVNAIRLHPVYVPEYHKDGTSGGYLRRFSCRVCIFSTDADLRAIREHDREAFDSVSNLETKIGFTMRPGASLVQIVEPKVSTPVETERQQRFSFCL